jgi:YHS domain-containing protein
MQKTAGDDAGKPGTSDAAALAKDPVCGMQVDPKGAEKAQLMTAYRGNQYYFCCESCKQQFDKNPGKFIKDAALNQKEHQPAASPSDRDDREATHD